MKNFKNIMNINNWQAINKANANINVIVNGKYEFIGYNDKKDPRLL